MWALFRRTGLATRAWLRSLILRTVLTAETAPKIFEDAPGGADISNHGKRKAMPSTSATELFCFAVYNIGVVAV